MYNITCAKEKDKENIYTLYKSLLYGAADWNETYPNMDTIEFDLKRNSLFIMKNEYNEIIGAISLDLDMEVENLDCWNKALKPSAELSRIAIRKDMQNKGLGKKLISFMIEYLKNNGYKSVHMLVKINHVQALKSYSVFNFKDVGRCNLFDKDFICLEKEL